MVKSLVNNKNGVSIPCIDKRIDNNEVPFDVHLDNEAYFEDVLETAREAFTSLDSGIWDWRDSFKKPNRDRYIESCKSNLESAMSQIQGLIDSIDQPDTLDKIDKEIMVEQLKETA